MLLSRYLVRLGIASLRIDFRGSGDSESDFSEMTVAREVEDVEAAFAYVRGLPLLDPERVMLLGFSMGGLVAALAAERVRPHRLALWAPALPELWLPLLRGGYAPPVILDYNGWPLGRAFLGRFRWLQRRATALHATTHEPVIRRFMLLGPGDACDELRRSE